MLRHLASGMCRASGKMPWHIVAAAAPSICDALKSANFDSGISPLTTNERLTAGFRSAPDTGPKK